MSYPISHPAVGRAQASVQAAIPLAQQDPRRPCYHFRPPAYWMNDPNGTIYHNGYYHLFYQHNPYGDAWGHMHWGHARSRDLVHWEHLPIALWPSTEKDEEHCFSGCAAVNGDGAPMLLYTSVGPEEDGERPAFQQWAALGDADWLTWQKHPANPILALDSHDGPDFEGDWRDPYIFTAAGRTFLVIGAAMSNQATVALYEAADATLSAWTFRRTLDSTPRSHTHFQECPNFFPVGSEWVLLTSPYRPVEYQVGHFDLETLTFQARTQGVLDPGYAPGSSSAHYYATNILYAPDGRCILLGWVRDFPQGMGWNGCLALPRELTIGPDHRPRQRPVAELCALRGPMQRAPAQTLPQGNTVLATAVAPHFELQTTLEHASGGTTELQLRARSETHPALTLTLDGERLQVGQMPPLDLPSTGISRPGHASEVELQLFVDGSVVELFVNQGELALTLVVDLPVERLDIAVSTPADALTLHEFTVWELTPTG